MKYLIITTLLITNLFSHFDDSDLNDFEKKCMICHDTYDKNETAPPIIAINQRYKKVYKELDLSINKIREFLIEPKHEKAIMQPAIKLYGLMPKQQLNEQQLLAFPEIVMMLDYEVPQWFDEHYKSHEFKEKEEKTLP